VDSKTNGRILQFYAAAEARLDRWHLLLQEVRAWARDPRETAEREQYRVVVSTSFQEIRLWEDFFAHPGQVLLNTLDAHITSGNATGASRLAQSISEDLAVTALMCPLVNHHRE